MKTKLKKKKKNSTTWVLLYKLLRKLKLSFTNSRPKRLKQTAYFKEFIDFALTKTFELLGISTRRIIKFNINNEIQFSNKPNEAITNNI